MDDLKNILGTYLSVLETIPYYTTEPKECSLTKLNISKTYNAVIDNMNSWFQDYNYIVDDQNLSEVIVLSNEDERHIILPDYHQGFKRRIDAEKYRLSALMKSDPENSETYKNQLERLEIEHPEWFI